MQILLHTQGFESYGVGAQKQPPGPLRTVVLGIYGLTQLIYKRIGLLNQL